MPVTEQLVPVRPVTKDTESASLSLPNEPIADARDAETAPGPVTAVERQARWRHRGGVLELSGPSVLISCRGALAAAGGCGYCAHRSG